MQRSLDQALSPAEHFNVNLKLNYKYFRHNSVSEEESEMGIF